MVLFVVWSLDPKKGRMEAGRQVRRGYSQSETVRSS